MNLGPMELLILLAIVLIFFGGSKLPKLARSLGQAQSEFKKGTSEAEAEPGPAPEPGPARSGPAPERGALQRPLPPSPDRASGTPAPSDRGRNPG